MFNLIHITISPPHLSSLQTPLPSPPLKSSQFKSHGRKKGLAIIIDGNDHHGLSIQYIHSAIWLFLILPPLYCFSTYKTNTYINQLLTIHSASLTSDIYAPHSFQLLAKITLFPICTSSTIVVVITVTSNGFNSQYNNTRMSVTST